MRFKVFRWLGEEFVSLSWEGNGEGTIADEMRELFGRFGDWLGRFELTLDNTVRTRMFVRDIDTWHVAAAERAKCMTGRARSTSSSHVRPERLGAKPRFSIDLLAMHAPQTGEQKILREYEPQTVVSAPHDVGQVGVLLGRDGHDDVDARRAVSDRRRPADDTLRDAGVSWERVERASFFLHRDESIPELRERLARTVEFAARGAGFHARRHSPGQAPGD
jgi:hypothetical protein